VTRYEPDAEPAYEPSQRSSPRATRTRSSHATAATVDEQVARLLREIPPARRARGNAPGPDDRTAESCTGGLLAARLTELPGSSDYFKGSIVAYSNDVKVAQAGVASELIERHGAVSEEVARALADGAISRLGVDVGVGLTAWPVRTAAPRRSPSAWSG